MTLAQLNAAPRGEVEYVFPLPHAPKAVPAVRRRVDAVLTGWDLCPDGAQDVLLVVSELITNAIVHALPPATLRLSRSRVDGRRAVHVEVTDTGPATAAGLSNAEADPDEHGRGLNIVTMLSARCGVHVYSGGTSRWAEVLVG
ncbi:ATP-binding protein [Streptomyces yaanensis]|uniref:ATP-binding protein n=1 Tax=Streptomyces yaanensis TaxID=1142239 RepID=A0ABV7S5Z1_9ACTN|nr:ATP-binding protein [Streptomyces sp. CGMCC 4.7035]WNB99966.1 ATP-binding protein [Streptomyces sp. CGMCC 4.7035]